MHRFFGILESRKIRNPEFRKNWEFRKFPLKLPSPSSHDAEAQALAGALQELHGEGVPQVLLLELGLVPVHPQPHLLGGLAQHADGLVVAGRPQVHVVHLEGGGGGGGGGREREG